MIEIKFIPTGNIFSLPDSEAIRIVSEDRGNYKVLKGKVPEVKQQKEKKSVQELVVVEEKTKTSQAKAKENKKQDKTE
jgi:hypothetical protein